MNERISLSTICSMRDRQAAVVERLFSFVHSKLSIFLFVVFLDLFVVVFPSKHFHHVFFVLLQCISSTHFFLLVFVRLNENESEEKL